ncbi:hypothetical protein BG004_002458, partial [Podila humilis]
IRFIETEFTEDPFPDTLLRDILKNDSWDDFKHSQYDPCMGNVCATGQFLGLPVIATPSGPTAASLALTLVQRKPNQQPPYNLLAPRTDLIDFPSAICQISMPFRASDAIFEERVLVRTSGFVTVLNPPSYAPEAISRIQPDYIEILDQTPCRSPSVWEDDIVHAATSPHLPNQYALIGNRGSISLWTTPRTSTGQDAQSESSGSGISGDSYSDSDSDEDDSFSDYVGRSKKRRARKRQRLKRLQENFKTSGVVTNNGCYNSASNIIVSRNANMDEILPEEPWRSCRWGAHPSQLVIGSNKDVSLIDMRQKDGQQCLFKPQTNEVVRAMQESEYTILAPFQTYIATSHQVAALDQRFTKRPLISWAPTVVTWTRRNAEITAYNVTRGSNESTQPLQLMGRAQDLSSFHNHAQYTNTTALRDPTQRNLFQTDELGRLAQGVCPPLCGLELLSSALLGSDDEGEDEDDTTEDFGRMRERDNTRHRKQRSCKQFSVLQYASTGALYAQELEIMKQSELDSDQGRLGISRESILSKEYRNTDDNEELTLEARTVAADGNLLVSELAHHHLQADDDDDHFMDSQDPVVQMTLAAKGLTASMKAPAKEMQRRANIPPLKIMEFHRHEDMDMTAFVTTLDKYLAMDPDAVSHDRTHIKQKIEQAKQEIRNWPSTTMTLYEILESIQASHYSIADREAIADGIQKHIEGSPIYVKGFEFLRRKIMRTQVLPCSRLAQQTRTLKDKEPSQETISEALHKLYRFPPMRQVQLKKGNQNEATDSILDGLANMSIPSSTHGSSNRFRAAGGGGTTATTGVVDVDDGFGDGDQDGDANTVMWPPRAVQRTRAQIIERLSQNLYFSTVMIYQAAVTKENSPYASRSQASRSQQIGTQKVAKTMELQYLAQDNPTTLNASSTATAPTTNTFKVPGKTAGILDEWEFADDDPFKYIYRPPANHQAAIDPDDETPENDEGVRRHEEYLMKVRMRREKRMMAVSAAAAAGASASMSTDMFTQLSQLPDEDGMFSLPTVVSASQSAAAGGGGGATKQIKPRPKSLTQIPSTKPSSSPSLHSSSAVAASSLLSSSQPQMQTKTKAVVATDANINTNTKAKRSETTISDLTSLSQRSNVAVLANRFSRPEPLFMDDTMFTTSFISSSQDWENLLPPTLSQDIASNSSSSMVSFGQGPVFFGAGGDAAPGVSVGMSFGKTRQDTDSTTTTTTTTSTTTKKKKTTTVVVPSATNSRVASRRNSQDIDMAVTSSLNTQQSAEVVYPTEEATASLSDWMLGGRSQDFFVGQSQEESMDMSSSSWMGASQPVSGAFANRPRTTTTTTKSGPKKKKKKVSTQGF